VYLTSLHRPSSPAKRLICFPHAGGSASFFRPWPQHLDPSVEVLAVQYPGRENRLRDALIPDMSPLVAEITEQLLAAPPRETVLFGHSMGAAVAYETLLRLEAAGAGHFTRLCVSGRSATEPARPPLSTDEELIAAVSKLGGTSTAVWEDPDLRELFLPIIRNDYHLIDTYERPPDSPLLRAEVIALTGDADPRVTPADADAWHRTTTGPTWSQVFPGDHFYLIEHASQVARLATSPARRPSRQT
jgi:pyochelin biosynthesis protein PchC